MPASNARPRGVYVDRTVGGAYDITVTASDGRDLMRVLVDPTAFEPRIVEGLERWLDRADPQLQLVTS